MTFNLSIGPVLALIAGIVILIVPKMLNYIVAIYLIAIGILGIDHSLENAEKVAEKGITCIEGKLFHRKDVGTMNLLQKRIDHMNSILKR